MAPFEIDFLDHVAIRVKEPEVSAQWYTRVLGLVQVQPKEWHPFPIFMMRGSFGVAIFPEQGSDSNALQNSVEVNNTPGIRIDHFAFNVSRENFLKAQSYFKSIEVAFTIQDHFYYHSIYLSDPDGHTVELTTLVKDLSSQSK